MLAFNLFRPIPISESLIINVDQGYGLNQVISTLEKKELISRPTILKAYVRIFNSRANIKAGEYLVSKDEITDVNNLNMFLDLNGNRMQTGNTSTMIFNVDTIVSYVSKFMSLQAGDIITTGTPPGVGMGKKPQVFLKPGDVMKLGIEGLGEQVQKTVVA